MWTLCCYRKRNYRKYWVAATLILKDKTDSSFQRWNSDDTISDAAA